MKALELRRQGWSTARIAERLGRDRKTVRSYLAGNRIPGSRPPARDESLRFLPYCRQRLAEDPHLPAAVLFGEVAALGYPGAYSTFTRALRKHQARPPCQLCQGTDPHGIDPGAPQSTVDAIQFEWLELPGPPPAWGCEGNAHLLLGLTCSGRWRGALAENEELPHLVEAMDHVMRRLGETARRWRFDPTPTVYCSRTNRVTPEFAQVAKHYGVTVEVRPKGAPRRAECATVHRTAHRWWSAVADDATGQDAEDSLDRVAARMDRHGRSTGDAVGLGTAPAATERPSDLPPTPFPIQVRADRIVSPQGLVRFRGNCYALPYNLSGAVVEVRRRLDEPYLSIATSSGAIIARYPVAPRGAGIRVVEGSDIALDRPASTARSPVACCRNRRTRPPSNAALAEADALRQRNPAPVLAPAPTDRGTPTRSVGGSP